MSTYPKWNDLPELDLYLDQVLLYVNQMTSETLTNDKNLTASMINNYVKHGHLEKPIKKKYKRAQLARLIAITALKNVFSIQEISLTLETLGKTYKSEKLYDDFAACMNNEADQAIPEIILMATQTLKLYHKTHQLVQHLKGATDESNL